MFYPNSNRSKRWEQIKQTMDEWRESHAESKVWNNSLRRYVIIRHRSVSETAYWGSKTPASAALISGHFNEIMRYAVRTSEEALPHSGNSKGFTSLIFLERKVEGIGTAKLTVGVCPDGELVQYCMTAVQPFGAVAVA